MQPASANKQKQLGTVGPVSPAWCWAVPSRVLLLVEFACSSQDAAQPGTPTQCQRAGEALEAML